jgi:hypothetical protein
LPPPAAIHLQSPVEGKVAEFHVSPSVEYAAEVEEPPDTAAKFPFTESYATPSQLAEEGRVLDVHDNPSVDDAAAVDDVVETTTNLPSPKARADHAAVEGRALVPAVQVAESYV